ncbi:ninjurin-2-like isoform X2 [Anopheles albimanus]|uniref:ninjurin-2-like isoform X2 n=1 Tax=Anopheles albimanus TaxID=7167 RepID=UPI00163E4B36|nr:ninjurin-2-like isoform X2 [Anopheles albimanus]
MAMASILPASSGGVGESDRVLKSMDANRYATKKTIAQGMLDIALLTANASQLKYILQVGEKHEFYALMLTLISISIILQITQGIACILLANYNINKEHARDTANAVQNFSLGLNMATVVVNIMINSMEVKHMDDVGLALGQESTTKGP